MSRFLPARSSPPLKPPSTPSTRSKPDDSRSSVLSSVPVELAALTPEEIDFIDAVIERAPASAATFLTVFKAYNDILQQRGVDPQHEVVYYGKLLKLGTLKGKNWGEKWVTVKQQQPGYFAQPSVSQPTKPRPGVSLPSSRAAGTPSYLSRLTAHQSTPRPAPSSSSYTTTSQPPPRTPNAPRAQVLARLTGALRSLERDEDAFTIHSHQDDQGQAMETATETDGGSEHECLQAPRFVRHGLSPSTVNTHSNSLGLTIGPTVDDSTPKGKHVLKKQTPRRTLGVWDGEGSESADSVRTPSTIPPSYRAAINSNDPVHKPISTPLRVLAQAHSKATLETDNGSTPIPSYKAPPSAREAVLKARERKGSVINEDDAWKKIRMARDEEDADRFRDERLLERCWEVWKQGYEWINNTHEQVGQARDNLILRLAVHRWRSRLAATFELQQRVSNLSNNRCLKVALQLWKFKFKERRQAAWRDDMRNRMKTIRESKDRKIKKDAWAKWRQSYKSHLSDQHFSEKLVVRFFSRWRRKVGELEQLEAAAEHFVVSREQMQMERFWDGWRRAVQVRTAERVMVERVSRRMMVQAMGVWKDRLATIRVAEQFYDGTVLKRAMRSWKGERERIRALEKRATKRLSRQNDVLLLAVMRVWKAHERGKLLERVRTARLLKQAWDTWKRRLRHERSQEDKALAFSMRPSSALASSTLRRWVQVFTTHRNAQTFAVHYHASHLRFNTLMTWRVQLREKLRLIKQAKIAEKQVVWNKWIEKLKQKRREKSLKQFEMRVLARYLREWTDRARRQRELKLAESIVQQRVALRVMTSTLSRWTNTVADRKFRELEGAQMYERGLILVAFKKWKGLCIRHVEELSLMESYQDVKREENMRRIFYHWLSAARQSRHRRLLLQKGEDEARRAVIARAWDKWKERYQDTRLQPLADAFVLQRKDNVVFRAFGIWHSKTRSLPAVRFHASHTKAHAWRVWRAAMPKALQLRAARDIHNKSVLAKVFEKWSQAYKTKMALKAVARARYLRLPTAAPRLGGSQSRPVPSSLAQPSTPSVFPRRAARPTSPDSDTTDLPIASSSKPRSSRVGIASLLARSRSPEKVESSRTTAVPKSVSRPKLSTRGAPTRDPSPTRSVASVATRHTEPLPRSTISTDAVGEAGRSKLWKELRGMGLRSRRPSTERRSVQPEPP